MTDTTTTAKNLRAALKSSQSNDAHLRLYYLFGLSLFDVGWQEHTAKQLLFQLCELCAADHGLIATESSGVLTTIATKGQALPVGSRIPMMGKLASLLKSPVKFSISNTGGTRIWTYANTDEYQEWLMPVAFNQKSIGMIAISGKNLASLPDDPFLQSICGLLGLALQQLEQKQLSTADSSALEVLTPREREIFALLPSGLSNVELGEKLGIAPGTVKIHVERIFSKLHLRDRTQAAVRAVEMGYKSTSKES